MKTALNYLIASSIFAATAACLQGSPMVSVGDQTDIFFNGKAGIRFDDNVALDRTNELDDVVYDFTPGVEVAIGRGQSSTKVVLLWQEDIVRYNDNDQFDNELTNLVGQGTYDGVRFDGTATAAYVESQSNSSSVNFVGDLVESRVTKFAATGEYEFSPKFSFGAGFDYQEISYVNSADGVIPDREVLEVPFDFYYELSPKLDLTGGYVYRTNDIETLPGTGFGGRPNFGNDPDDNIIRIGLRGEITPKLNGSVRVGWRDREFTSGPIEGESVDGFYMRGDLIYDISQKMAVQLGLFDDFSFGGSGETISTTGFNVDLRYAFSELWFFSLVGGYTTNDYEETGRSDDYFNFGFNVDYEPNDFVRVTAGYRLNDNDSSVDGFSYGQTILHLSASLRY